MIRQQTDLLSGKKGDGPSITWENPEELEAYVKELQLATEKLSKKNRSLRKYHVQVQEKVLQLMNTDLLKAQPKWKEGLMSIREIMTTVLSQGYHAKDMKTWKVHWDHQLYKALEVQYQMGIESLNENLPEIRVELTYRQQQLQFKPPLEEVRGRYYREMKKFINIPNNFRGVGESGAEMIFPTIIERNAHYFITCFRKGEELLQKVAKVKQQFQDWVVLGGSARITACVRACARVCLSVQGCLCQWFYAF